MSELQKELCKAQCGAANMDHIEEEIADVLLTIGCIIHMHGLDMGRIMEIEDNKYNRAMGITTSGALI